MLWIFWFTSWEPVKEKNCCTEKFWRDPNLKFQSQISNIIYSVYIHTNKILSYLYGLWIAKRNCYANLILKQIWYTDIWHGQEIICRNITTSYVFDMYMLYANCQRPQFANSIAHLINCQLAGSFVNGAFWIVKTG